MPCDHSLASATPIAPGELAAQTFIGISDVAPVLRSVIQDYLKRSGTEIVPTLEVDNFAMAMSLVASTRGAALLPASVHGYLPQSIISRPMSGEWPTIDLLIGYHRANPSPILLKFLSGIDRAATQIYGNAR
jgi:LysR family transcriptional regulator, hca operon transcriptional activator